MTLKSKIILYLYLLSITVYGQQDPQKDYFIEQHIEAISENNEDENIDYTNLLEELQHAREHPINLNYCTREELQRLNLISEFEIANLFEHIEKNGKLILIYELQTIEGFDLSIIEKLLPYVKVENQIDAPHISFSEVLHFGEHSWISRYQQIIEKQKGYSEINDSLLTLNPNSRYLGNASSIFSRYRFTYSNLISAGFAAQKDPGEEFFRGTQKRGFDFYSGHFFIRKIKKVEAIALGDFQAQFGQGLSFWSGLALGKTSDPMLLKKSARGLSPYTSVMEALYLRGMGITFSLTTNLSWCSFFSLKRIDGNVSKYDSLSNEVQEVSSFQLSGFHRTEAELFDRKAIQEQLAGSNLKYIFRRFQLGITAATIVYDVNVSRDLSVYNRFEFNRKKNAVAGFDYNYLFRNMNFYGEFSRSLNGGMACLNGLLMTLDPKFSISLLQRNYQRNFQAIMSNAIGEATKNQNENGFLAGFVMKPKSKINISAYYDYFHFPWLTFSTKAPSYGHDYLVQINYTPSKKTDFYARVRMRKKQKNSDDDVAIDYLLPYSNLHYRANINYSVTPVLKFRSRLEWSRYKETNKTASLGFMMYQDVIYKAMNSPISFSFRYALFDVDSYDARIYAYENDVLFAYSIPAMYNKGSRTYLTLNYNFTRKLEVWFRIANTFYSNVKIISEGTLNEINRPTRSEIKMQIRYKF